MRDTFHLEVITPERTVFSDEVEMVVVPAVQGNLGVLPNHTPLMTMLQPGVVRIRKEGEEIRMAVTGGFFDARPDKVTVLADAAELAEEIDVERARAAYQRALARLRSGDPGVDVARAQAALDRAAARLRAAGQEVPSAGAVHTEANHK